MIVQNNEALGGRSTVIANSSFICKVNTVKTGLFMGGLKSMVYNMSHYGTYSKMPSKNDMIAVIEYHDYHDNAKRLQIHDDICKYIDKQLIDSKSIIDAVSCACVIFDGDNHIKGYIPRWLR